MLARGVPTPTTVDFDDLAIDKGRLGTDQPRHRFSHIIGLTPTMEQGLLPSALVPVIASACPPSRSNPAWCDAIDSGNRAQRLSQAVRESHDRCFRRAKQLTTVAFHTPRSLVPTGVDQGWPRCALMHVLAASPSLGHRSANQHSAHDIDLPKFVQSLLKGQLSASSGQHIGPGIVDPSIDSTLPIKGAIDQLLQRSGLAIVSGDCTRLHAKISGIAAGFLQAAEVAARVSEDVVPKRGQLERDSSSDPRSSPGHDGYRAWSWFIACYFSLANCLKYPSITSR